MARPVMTQAQRAAQRAITTALYAAQLHRSNADRYAKCIAYAARIIDELRLTLDTVDPRIDRAWRD